MKPVVTIGICVKNGEPTIREAINSVVDQDFPQELMEVIVSDGASQDKTLPIIRETLSKTLIPLKVFKEERNLSSARQKIVDNASGDYVLWLDGDVILSKSYIKQLENFMKNNPKAAIAVGRIGLLPNENWVALLESIGYVVESLKFVGNETYNLIGTRGSIFRVEAIKMVGGFDLQIKVSQEDTDVSYKIRSAGWKLFTTKTMFYERQRKTWRALWKRHSWYGYGLHFIQHKHKELKIFTNKTNDRIIFSSQAYKLTHRKVVFLLPLNFVFRKIALLFGFLKAHIDGYGHDLRAKSDT